MLVSSSRLLDYLSSKYSAAYSLEIANLRDITTGWESQIFSFDLSIARENTPSWRGLILRRYYGQTASAKASHEFHSLLQLARQAYPVPEVLFFEEDAALLELPFVIMERIDGPTLWEEMNRASPTVLAEQIHHFVRLLVDLHRLDWRPFTHNPAEFAHAGTGFSVDRFLQNAQTALSRFANPGFIDALAWLESHKSQVSGSNLSVTHNDFHPNNILLRAGQTPVVIDWTSCAISDYRFDLAWTLLLSQAYRGEEMRRMILDEYQNQAGEPVQSIEFFEVAACCRRLFDVLTSLRVGADALGMRPEAVKLMREQIDPLRQVYLIFQAYTNLTIPEIETLLTAS